MGLMRGIRKNVRGIYWFVIIAVVITFVFWGTRLGSVGRRRHAGIVFGEKVSMRDFRLQFLAAREQAARYEYMTGQLVSADQIEALTWQRIAKSREAERWRISIPMKEVRKQIARQFSRGGHFDQDSYESYLQSRRLTEEELADMVRDDMRIAELERLVSDTVVVTPQELRERYNYDKEQRKIKFHMVEVDSLLPAFAASAKAERYYLAHTNEFRQPKKVAVQYIMVEKKPFVAKVSLTEQELRAYYEKNKSSYRTSDGKTPAFDEIKPQIQRILRSQKANEMARQRAEKVFKFADASEMREVARKNKLILRETGLIPEKGDVAEEPAKDPQFRKAAFETPLGGLSAIVETRTGYCVLSPVRIVAPRIASFEEVRKTAAEKERAQRLKEVAQHAGVPTAQVGTFVKEHSVVPSDIDVTYEEAQRYYESHKSEFMKPKKVKVLYLMVEKAPFDKKVKITEREIKAEYKDKKWKYKDEAGKQKPLADVRQEVEKDLRARKADDMAKQRAEEIFTVYRPQRMKQQALKYGLTLRESRLFAQGENIDDYIGNSATFASRAFQTELGQVSDMFSTEIGYCVLSPVQVVDEAVADFEEVAEEAAEKAKLSKAEILASRIAYDLSRRVREKMTNEKKDFDAACNELGLKVEESGYFRRDDSAIEKVGATGRSTSTVFESEPGKIGSPKRVPRGSFFYAVTEVKPPSDEEFAKDRDSYYSRLAREKAKEAFQEWAIALLQQANVRKNLPTVRKGSPNRRTQQ